jgi:hypothetical protein
MKTRSFTAIALAAAVHAVALSSPASSFAQSRPAPQLQPVPGGDTVVLANGGTVKGTLVELLPDHVTVQLPNGQLALIQTRDVHHIERQATTPGASAQPTPSREIGPQGESVFVHIDSPRPVRLLHRASRGPYETLCESPCDAMVPLAGTYQIAGDGMPSSRELTLRGNPGDRVILNVDPASRGTMVTGWVIFGVGGLTVLVGLSIMLIGALAGTLGHSKGDGDVIAAGGITTLAGLAGVGTGLALAIPNLRTRAEQEVRGREVSKEDRWLRMPDAQPQATTLPVLSFTF